MGKAQAKSRKLRVKPRFEPYPNQVVVEYGVIWYGSPNEAAATNNFASTVYTNE